MTLASNSATARRLFQIWGTVSGIVPGRVEIAGVSLFAGVGQDVIIETAGGHVFGEIIGVSKDHISALLFSSPEHLRIGDKALLRGEPSVEIGDHWLGKIINYRGEAAGSSQTGSPFSARRVLQRPPPPAHTRRALGGRLATGLMITDTLLPICAGQRMGLFAGSGVGKSTLMAALANGLSADRIVIGLIGERSREVGDFFRSAISPDIMHKTTLIAATSSEPPAAKKRAAFCAVSAAEHFRDQGHSVLLLIDSITRFAEAHRETALLAGETPALNAFPPSTVRAISELVERAGPGSGDSGDITGVFSVLVAGSDMEEPVADMIRGILDGHIILDRTIAERGRYPAIDVLKSVSRSLPKAASPDENTLIAGTRRMLSLYEDVAPMLRASLYEFGNDADSDRAISLYPALDQFISKPNPHGNQAAFTELGAIFTGSSEEYALKQAADLEQATEKEVLTPRAANL